MDRRTAIIEMLVIYRSRGDGAEERIRKELSKLSTELLMLLLDDEQIGRL